MQKPNIKDALYVVSCDVKNMPDVPDCQSFQKTLSYMPVVHEAYKGYAVATTLPEYIVSYDFLHIKSFFHERRTTLDCQLLSLQNRLIKISLTIFWISTNGKHIQDETQFELCSLCPCVHALFIRSICNKK